jgi:hypothetical protein
MKESIHTTIPSRKALVLFAGLTLLGFGAFVVQVSGKNPGRAWQAYLINFLLWSAIAQGGLLFSVVMHITKARWSGRMQSLAESFAAFFPLSLVLFLVLFLGKDYLFPGLHGEVRGLEVWLNLPFLFSRDLVGLLLLYGIGLAYTVYALRLRADSGGGGGGWIGSLVRRGWTGSEDEVKRSRHRMTTLSVLYILAYGFILTLIAFDLIMSMEPPFYSTLFGAYAFAKAFYLGLLALMVVAGLYYLRGGEDSGLRPSDFHDLGKLVLAFCLVWADFFYVQLLIIWYGNISEETRYLIQRVMLLPWRPLAWTVFVMGFVIPFFVLLNKRVKERPLVMIPFCVFVIVGLWLEHLLLVGPALNPGTVTLPVGPGDVLITLGFLGLMALAVTLFLRWFLHPVVGRS